MKFCNFYTPEGRVATGLVRDGLVYDLGDRVSLRQIVRGNNPAIKGERVAAEADTPSYPADSVKYANLTSPSKIACVGLNYKRHAQETGGKPPEHPVIFSKFNDSLCPHETEVPLPRWQRCFDYEAELVIVMGKEAWNVGEEDADKHIFGYTVGNDLSARDCQFLSNQWLIGKTFPCFAPVGPWVVTKDEFNPDDHHRIVCRRNGEIVQDDYTDGMIFSCRQIVSFVSRYCRLQPGDLIFTGTPSGVILGKAKGTRDWLVPGETLEVEVEGICTLKNKLI
ncbi:MAG: fumarylacetoacetate hydrolase family protein [Oscillospiraceae bacterium]|nr:fumarylacetoacetate hydrolase family protein [Oscillospiraceae bacterium]